MTWIVANIKWVMIASGNDRAVCVVSARHAQGTQLNAVEAQRSPANEGVHLILYDGVCGLCNRLNQFVLNHDRDRLFHFASLQGAGARFLERFGGGTDDLTTFVVLVNYRGAAPVQLTKSDAALFVMTILGWPWKAAAGVFAVVPKAFRDHLYDAIARHRYRVFGRLESCPIPRPEHRSRFIDS